MALFHTTVLDNQIKALPTVDTASGSIATFNTDITDNLVSVKCQIVATQSGSGTPSPSNPRPITTYTSLNLSHSGSDTSNPNVTNIPFGQTVANGVLDVTTGRLRVTYIIVTINNNWNMYSSYFYKTFNDKIVPNVGDTDNYLLCSMLPYCGVKQYASQMPNNSIGQAENKNIYIIDNSCADINAFHAKYNGATIIYPLETPIEIQLDSITLQALLNENNIWCDTGDTEVKFILSVGKKIS